MIGSRWTGIVWCGSADYAQLERKPERFDTDAGFEIEHGTILIRSV